MSHILFVESHCIFFLGRNLPTNASFTLLLVNPFNTIPSNKNSQLARRTSERTMDLGPKTLIFFCSGHLSYTRKVYPRPSPPFWHRNETHNDFSPLKGTDIHDILEYVMRKACCRGGLYIYIYIFGEEKKLWGILSFFFTIFIHNNALEMWINWQGIEGNNEVFFLTKTCIL